MLFSTHWRSFRDSARALVRRTPVSTALWVFFLQILQAQSPAKADLEAVLRQHGVLSYSIFLDPATSDLFAYAEIESEERWAAIAATEVCQRWWLSMSEIMPSNPDGSPKSRDLREVFHIGDL